MGSLPMVFDIRGNDVEEDLIQSLVDGFNNQPKKFPSTLVWDQEGLRIFEKIMHSVDYYLTRREEETLKVHVRQIARSISAGDVIIELGCGNLQKTKIILNELERRRTPCTYYALDLDDGEIMRCLANLNGSSGGLERVCSYGLHGSYLDCIPWMRTNPELRNRSVTFLWLGSSLANFTPEEATELLTVFRLGIQDSAVKSAQFVLGIDSNRDEEQIRRAYDIPDGLSRAFVMNGLRRANTLTEGECFNLSDWQFSGSYDPNLNVYRTNVATKRSVKLQIRGTEYEMEPNEKAEIICSWKWSPDEAQEIFLKSGFDTRQVLKHPSQPYAFYVIGCM